MNAQPVANHQSLSSFPHAKTLGRNIGLFIIYSRFLYNHQPIKLITLHSYKNWTHSTFDRVDCCLSVRCAERRTA